MIYTYNHQQQQIIHAIAQLLNEFHLDFDGFCKALRQQYVFSINEKYKGIARTALKSGIDRRVVSSIIKNEETHSKRPLLLSIINAIRDKAEHKNMTMPKNGINSMASIIEEVAYGTTTPKTVLDVLSKTGVIEDQGVKFKFLGYPPSYSDQQALEDFTSDFCKLIEDFIQSKQSENNNL